MFLRILNPFWAREEFKRLSEEKKNWLIPIGILLLIIILAIIAGQIINPKLQPVVNEYLSRSMDPQQLETVEKFSKISNVIGIVIIVITVFLGWLLKSVLIHTISSFLGGATVKFKDSLNLMGYTYLPIIFHKIFGIYQAVNFEPPKTYEELIALTKEQTMSLLGFVKNYANIWILWSIFLVVMLLKSHYKLSTRKALSVALICYIIIWGLTLAWIYISKSLIPG
ncbi:MAG: Yip1 family protein [Candidatus Methanofastidiosia archaeon]